MIDSKDCFCVILAGGRGRRLWPCSREQRPKQFVDFFGTGRTQLQQTFDRYAELMPKENIFISTSYEYTHYVESQLPELPVENILSEPIHRNTAPSVAWASYRISHINPNAKIVCDEERVRPEKSEVNRLLGCNEKIKRLTDWEPKYSFEEGLAETIEFLRNNLDKYKVDIYNV